MISEQLLKSPGFLYKLNGAYYYLGKWICRECTQTDALDCVFMYHMCRGRQEEPETNLYFQKIRAYSDFALEAPCNPSKVREEINALLEGLSDSDLAGLETQFLHFQEDYQKYCATSLH